ncbi:tetratricopeptide repeat protein [Nostoc sp. KVJ3]|uniref:tetratricopeptide repeat protein n=1 Tax=Nostoc sp. KVJ3 TaxID=457945 RepID=UPI002238F18E|nr:tetratricopeptide repeat protein [Nostoc sp. KVJ3]MCW5315070.1 tetratricopeptide repeat protein [Nostoc sp. KVJ3]
MNKEQQHRLEEERRQIQQQWENQSEKVKLIRKALAIENDPTTKFKLEQQLLEEGPQLASLGDELDKIEAELRFPLQNKTTTEKRLVGNQAIPEVPVWQGRDELLKELQTKLLQPENPLKVLALIGQGGIGKTSLAVKLLEALGVNCGRSALTPVEKGANVEECPYECFMYFKAQQGTSFDDVAGFLLIETLGIQTTETLKTADEKITKIIEWLAQTRTLLVLDNLESILHPANHPQAGRAISADWGKLLNALVYYQHQSQTLLTSREVPADLADIRYEDAEPDSELVYIERISGVATVAGVEILRQRQLRDSVTDLQWVSERVEGHVFLLTQLAAIGKGKPGYLRKHSELVTKKAELILREQLVRQSEAARDLLKQMCVLRVGIDIQGLTFLRLYTDEREQDERFEIAADLGEPAELTEVEISETQAILEQLVDSSLVQSRYDEKQCEEFYDLHRVIVEFIQREYKNELPNLLKSIYKFYCSSKNVKNPKTLEDLRPVLEAQYFAFQLGNYSEAYYLVTETLREYLRWWGNWNLLKDLYEQVLPHIEEEECCICWQWIGRIHRDLGNWDEAAKCFHNALAIAQKQESKTNLAYCNALLGNIEQFRGNWDAAETLYRQSLIVRTELGDHSGMANSWALLGDIERYRGNWDAAETLYRQSLELQTELSDRSGMANSWALLGDIERYRGNWDAAETLYQQSLELQTELGDCSGMATNWEFLGNIEQLRGNWDAAESLYRQSLKLQTELGDRSGMATSWALLGNIEQLRGNWDAAKSLYRQSLELQTELGDRSGMATIWAVLGNIEQLRGNWDAAESLYRQSLTVKTELGDRSGMANSWAVLGNIEQCRGNWDAAESLYRQSLTVKTELGDRSGMATVWAFLGNIEQCRGNWDAAESLYRQSLTVKTELGDRSGMANSWGVLGYIEQCRGNWDAAETLYRQSLTVRTELGDRSGMASIWGVLGYIEQCRGRWDAAETLYLQCLEVETELGDRSGMANSWGVLGDIERNRGNWDAAESLYRQSLKLQTELGNRSGMANSWGVLGYIEQCRGRWDAAETLYRQCLEVETELGDRSGMASSWRVLGDIERNRGNWDAAETLYRQCLEVETELGDRSGMAYSYCGLGKNECDRGNLEAAEQFSKQALELAEELGMTDLVAEVNYDLARLEQKRSNTELAQQHYNTAHQIFQQLGAAKDLEKIKREWELD